MINDFYFYSIIIEIKIINLHSYIIIILFVSFREMYGGMPPLAVRSLTKYISPHTGILLVNPLTKYLSIEGFTYVENPIWGLTGACPSLFHAPIEIVYIAAYIVMVLILECNLEICEAKRVN